MIQSHILAFSWNMKSTITDFENKRVRQEVEVRRGHCVFSKCVMWICRLLRKTDFRHRRGESIWSAHGRPLLQQWKHDLLLKTHFELEVFKMKEWLRKCVYSLKPFYLGIKTTSVTQYSLSQRYTVFPSCRTQLHEGYYDPTAGHLHADEIS